MKFTIEAEIRNLQPGAPNQKLPLPNSYPSFEQAKMALDQAIVDGGVYYDHSRNEVHFYPMTSIVRFNLKSSQ